ncbi:MAG TPA: PLP-dependent cysteine synthase family protein [Oligoflexia bacterium]|nr:PLP-dependent cysteine synthase family protein [Oligoflexia bacterium]HMR24757.1 PLP-dependent cysteine synthase family protein [Oligoflexia bacterium]
MQCRTWVCDAIKTIEQDFQRSADTHLLKLNIPKLKNIHLYFKDESIHPTGSLKHRLARSLFLHGICNGKITANTTVIEASSGSTAVSEAYFARLLNLKFIAVMPKSTSVEKIEQIKFYGGECFMVDDHREIYSQAESLAKKLNGHYMDQFTFAEQATDWRGNNNIADSIFEQMAKEDFPDPSWIVVGAGTGGTSATIGRYIRYLSKTTKLCVVDPENSVFFDYYKTADKTLCSEQASGIEGIGRPRVEPSFIASVIDEMIRVPNAASIAGVHFLEKLLGKKYGGSTGTNLFGMINLAHQMYKNKQQGSIVGLMCDNGDRYLQTYYNPDWLKLKGYDINQWYKVYEKFYDTLSWLK